MTPLRHANEWVGALVIVAVAVMLFAALQAGLLRDWFKATSELRLILPDTGVAGLEIGADVEILGTKAGIVRRIVINPNQQMYAEIDIDEQARAFIRRDSKAVIRRRFGVAGATFVEISRGAGDELDWSFAVVEATTERAPTDSVSALIDEAREKIFPILDNVGAITRSLAEIVDRVSHGEGSVGRLLTDQSLVREIEATIARARDTVTTANQLMAELKKSADNVRLITENAAGPEGVPALLARADETMKVANETISSAKVILDDLAILSERLPTIAENVEGGTANFPVIARNVEEVTRNLPALLTQMQVTIRQLDQLIVQIRGSWLLGGGKGAQPQEPGQFSPSQVLP